MNSIQTGHLHRVMRDYTKKVHNNLVSTKVNMYNIIKSNIYDTFIFYLNNLDNINFIKYYVKLISMIRRSR